MAMENLCDKDCSLTDFELSYSFAPTSHLEAHYHDFFQVILLNSGKTTYLVEGRKYILTKNNVLILSPNELHLEKPTPKYSAEKYVLTISKSCINSLSTTKTKLSQAFSHALTRKKHFIELSDDTRDLLFAIIQKIQNLDCSLFGYDLSRQILLQEFLIELNIAEETQKEESNSENNFVEEVSDYISENISLDLKAEIIAKKFFVNKYHLAHKFKTETGMTLHKFIMEKRLIYAKQLLSDGLNVKDVYLKCGFSDYSNFFRAFKERFDYTPKEFYKNNHNQ